MSLPNPQLRFADRMLKGQTGSAVFDLSTELHLHTAKTMQHSVGPSEERKNVPMYGQPTLPRLPRLVHIRSSGYVLQRRGKRLLQRGLPRGVLLGLLVGPLQPPATPGPKRVLGGKDRAPGGTQFGEGWKRKGTPEDKETAATDRGLRTPFGSSPCTLLNHKNYIKLPKIRRPATENITLLYTERLSTEILII